MPDNTHCHVETVSKVPSKQELATLTRTRLQVQGLGCGNCARRVENALVHLYGVVTASVDPTAGLALVEHNRQFVSATDLTQAVAGAGNDGRHKYRAHQL